MRLFEGTQWDRPPKCERCDRLESECECPPESEPPRAFKEPAKQTARLTIEKRKRGKQVVVVRGLSEADNDLSSLLSQLKSKCGAGGTIRDGLIEIQGNQLHAVRHSLEAIGYRVK